MDNIYEIRKVEQDDVDGLAELYQRVWPTVSFNKSEKARFVILESKGVSYCAIKDGEFVGSRTSFYMPAYYGKQPLKCVQFADSCIRSDCRRQGLFLKMNQAFLKGFFEENGGELVYNISVDDSRAAYEKLGWNYIKSLQGHRRYMRPFRTLLKIHFNPRKLRGALYCDETTVTHPLDVKLLEARERFFLLSDTIHIKYTVETFNWRLKSGNGIKMLDVTNIGAVVYKLAHKKSGVLFVIIGEIFLYEYTYKNFKAVLAAINEKLTPDVISACITQGHPLRQFYIQAGIKDRNNRSFLNHGVKVLSDEMKSICYNPKNWALSMFDIDTF